MATCIEPASPDQAIRLFEERFGSSNGASTLSVPGRVNLIGEHIDYHGLPVLPIAIQRRITLAYKLREDRQIRSASDGLGERVFEWTARLEPSPQGDWTNYVKAAAQAVMDRWQPRFGIDAAVTSDLPAAAGLSSSSALLVGFTLALLRANGIEASFDQLMEVLPEAEYFVGTRGGGMDHAAVLGARKGCALLIEFVPFSARPVPVPDGWSFLVAHSLTTAHKSGSSREKYNARRAAGSTALKELGLTSYREALERYRNSDLLNTASKRLDGDQFAAFAHVVQEADRVDVAVRCMAEGDADHFGRVLTASHESLRDLLCVSRLELDELVVAALASGALGARLTGAGFGGCAVVFCRTGDLERVREGLIERFYSKRPEFDPQRHLIVAQPSAGALFA